MNSTVASSSRPVELRSDYFFKDRALFDIPPNEDDNEDCIGAFKLGPILGRGVTGTVRLGTHKDTGFQVALKIMKKKYLKSKPKLWDKVKREVAILKLIDHPYILKLYDVYETNSTLYLILENVKGGELFDYVISKGRLKPLEALRLVAQIVQGLEHCHAHSICHRDLKPENLLLDDNLNIKIADFGMAQLMKGSSMLRTSCGSPHYASPEIIAGGTYDGKRTDVWSIGVILFALVTGSLPFDDDHLPTLLRMVSKGQYHTPDFVPRDVSDLISKMLTVDPRKRIAMEHIKNHVCYRNTTFFQLVNKEGEDPETSEESQTRESATDTNTESEREESISENNVAEHSRSRASTNGRNVGTGRVSSTSVSNATSPSASKTVSPNPNSPLSPSNQSQHININSNNNININNHQLTTLHTNPNLLPPQYLLQQQHNQHHPHHQHQHQHQPQHLHNQLLQQQQTQQQQQQQHYMSDLDMILHDGEKLPDGPQQQQSQPANPNPNHTNHAHYVTQQQQQQQPQQPNDNSMTDNDAVLHPHYGVTNQQGAGVVGDHMEDEMPPDEEDDDDEDDDDDDDDDDGEGDEGDEEENGNNGGESGAEDNNEDELHDTVVPSMNNNLNPNGVNSNANANANPNLNHPHRSHGHTHHGHTHSTHSAAPHHHRHASHHIHSNAQPNNSNSNNFPSPSIHSDNVQAPVQQHLQQGDIPLEMAINQFHIQGSGNAPPLVIHHPQSGSNTANYSPNVIPLSSSARVSPSVVVPSSKDNSPRLPPFSLGFAPPHLAHMTPLDSTVPVPTTTTVSATASSGSGAPIASSADGEFTFSMVSPPPSSSSSSMPPSPSSKSKRSGMEGRASPHTPRNRKTHSPHADASPVTTSSTSRSSSRRSSAITPGDNHTKRPLQTTPSTPSQPSYIRQSTPPTPTPGSQQLQQPPHVPRQITPPNQQQSLPPQTFLRQPTPPNQQQGSAVPHYYPPQPTLQQQQQQAVSVIMHNIPSPSMPPGAAIPSRSPNAPLVITGQNSRTPSPSPPGSASVTPPNMPTVLEEDTIRVVQQQQQQQHFQLQQSSIALPQQFQQQQQQQQLAQPHPFLPFVNPGMPPIGVVITPEQQEAVRQANREMLEKDGKEYMEKREERRRRRRERRSRQNNAEEMEIDETVLADLESLGWGSRDELRRIIRGEPRSLVETESSADPTRRHHLQPPVTVSPPSAVGRQLWQQQQQRQRQRSNSTSDIHDSKEVQQEICLEKVFYQLLVKRKKARLRALRHLSPKVSPHAHRRAVRANRFAAYDGGTGEEEDDGKPSISDSVLRSKSAPISSGILPLHMLSPSHSVTSTSSMNSDHSAQSVASAHLPNSTTAVHITASKPGPASSTSSLSSNLSLLSSGSTGSMPYLPRSISPSLAQMQAMHAGGGGGGVIHPPPRTHGTPSPPSSSPASSMNAHRSPLPPVSSPTPPPASSNIQHTIEASSAPGATANSQPLPYLYPTAAVLNSSPSTNISLFIPLPDSPPTSPHQSSTNIASLSSPLSSSSTITSPAAAVALSYTVSSSAASRHGSLGRSSSAISLPALEHAHAHTNPPSSAVAGVPQSSLLFLKDLNSTGPGGNSSHAARPPVRTDAHGHTILPGARKAGGNGSGDSSPKSDGGISSSMGGTTYARHHHHNSRPRDRDRVPKRGSRAMSTSPGRSRRHHGKLEKWDNSLSQARQQVASQASSSSASSTYSALTTVENPLTSSHLVPPGVRHKHSFSDDHQTPYKQTPTGFLFPDMDDEDDSSSDLEDSDIDDEEFNRQMRLSNPFAQPMTHFHNPFSTDTDNGSGGLPASHASSRYTPLDFSSSSSSSSSASSHPHNNASSSAATAARVRAGRGAGGGGVGGAPGGGMGGGTSTASRAPLPSSQSFQFYSPATLFWTKGFAHDIPNGTQPMMISSGTLSPSVSMNTVWPVPSKSQQSTHAPSSASTKATKSKSSKAPSKTKKPGRKSWFSAIFGGGARRPSIDKMRSLAGAIAKKFKGDSVRAVYSHKSVDRLLNDLTLTLTQLRIPFTLKHKKGSKLVKIKYTYMAETMTGKLPHSGRTTQLDTASNTSSASASSATVASSASSSSSITSPNNFGSLSPASSPSPSTVSSPTSQSGLQSFETKTPTKSEKPQLARASSSMSSSNFTKRLRTVRLHIRIFDGSNDRCIRFVHKAGDQQVGRRLQKDIESILRP